MDLLILAAGIGSRYGKLKPLDAFSSGKVLMEYSIEDAVLAGFSRVVFVIRPETEEAFEEQLFRKLRGKVDVAVAYQTLDTLPLGYFLPVARQKPWGTGHALWCARKQLHGPFGILNADDYYGRESMRLLGNALRAGENVLIGFELGRTLSEQGKVSRGVCEVSNGSLQRVTEYTQIFREGVQIFASIGEQRVAFSGEEVVSLNLWGFQAPFLEKIDRFVSSFFEKNVNKANVECFLPNLVQAEIDAGLHISVIRSPDKWLGLTYAEDKAHVENELSRHFA
ncbi:MAG: hypothetical protein A2Y14_05695 [Verrucomicrobia bacterium GWF2_51_19]|nr:MAG: hypothetical protein A2Y14_05695 [Verrucomicrobia bacterium GWF2_51_19]HCJ12145.1 nucleotidyltransferase [Opitutae bacterium]